MSSNDSAGEQTLKIMLKAAWFLILLIPGLVKLIYRGIVWIIAQFKGNKEGNPTDEITGVHE